MAKGEQTLQPSREREPPAVQGNFGSNSKEVQMTITHRAEGSSKRVYNFEKNECESYNAKIACYRVCHTSKSAKQSPSGRQASPLCGQLANSHCGPVGIEYCSGVFNSLPGGPKTGSSRKGTCRTLQTVKSFMLTFCR